jgi:hypothetical protein
MSLRDDLNLEVAAIFKDQWEVIFEGHFEAQSLTFNTF